MHLLAAQGDNAYTVALTLLNVLQTVALAYLAATKRNDRKSNDQ